LYKQLASRQQYLDKLTITEQTSNTNLHTQTHAIAHVKYLEL